MKNSFNFNSPEDIKREWFSTEVVRDEGIRTLQFKLTELGVSEIANKGYGALHLEYWTKHQKEIAPFNLSGQGTTAPLNSDSAKVTVQAVHFDPDSGLKIARSREIPPDRSDDDLAGSSSFLPIQRASDMQTVWRFDKTEGTLFIHQDFVDHVDGKTYMNLLSHLILPEVVRQVAQCTLDPDQMNEFNDEFRDAWTSFIDSLQIPRSDPETFANDCADAFAHRHNLNEFTTLLNAFNDDTNE